MTETIRVWAGALNQHPMAFASNTQHIKDSLAYCQQHKCMYRPGIELEVSGYSCGEHLLEKETIAYTWQAVRELLESKLTEGLLWELGLPVAHEGKIYNCLAVFLDTKLQYIRPKLVLDKSAPNNEIRFFEPFDARKAGDTFSLPPAIQELTGQKTVPFGVYYARLGDHSIAQAFDAELGSEHQAWLIKVNPTFLSVPNSSIFEAGAASKSADSLKTLSEKTGSHIVRNSLKGSDNSKLLFSCLGLHAHKGSVMQTASLSSLSTTNFIHLSIATDQLAVQQKVRIAGVRSLAIATTIAEHTVKAPEGEPDNEVQQTGPVKEIEPELELLTAMSSYLWEQLTKTGAAGFFVPLSGGADSSLIAFSTFFLCKRVFDAKDPEVRAQFRRTVNDPAFEFVSPEQLAHKILFAAYLPASFSGRTRKHAEQLAARLNANFFEIGIQNIFNEFKSTVENALQIKTSFRQHDQFQNEDLALQNVQARIRLVLSYLCAQLLPVKFGLSSFLLCFGTGNLSEVLRGYYTKYDCSSGDLNIIGSLNKSDIKKILLYSAANFDNFEVLTAIALQAPTAELRPPENGRPDQTDENDMGFTYEELDFLGLQMKLERKGREGLVEAFREKFPEADAAEKVDLFLRQLRLNRHKAGILPPSVHLTPYDVDGAFDQRPFLYLKEPRLAKREIMDD